MSAYAYYNEVDPFAAQKLRERIDEGLIAPGYVDQRSVVDIRPAELGRYTQVHLFAGIGVWSEALRAAGWPDERPVWTGSPPCQPFSSRGRREGFRDPRHLWPTFYYLLKQSKADVVFGEQVAGKDGLRWLDVVQTDLDRADYAFGVLDLCAAGVGAPHPRQRLYWVAESPAFRRVVDGVAHADGGRLARTGLPPREATRGPGTEQALVELGKCQVRGGPGAPGELWGNVDWIKCRDGRWRPVEPGFVPLVDGFAGRNDELVVLGNTLVLPVARMFVEAYLDYRPDWRPRLHQPDFVARERVLAFVP